MIDTVSFRRTKMQDFQLYLNQDTVLVTCQLVKHQTQAP